MHLTGLLQFLVEGAPDRSSYEVWEHGALGARGDGVHSEATWAVVQGASTHEAWRAGLLAGHQLLEQTQFVDLAARAREEVSLPPLCINPAMCEDALPHLPGATISVERSVIGGPFGDYTYHRGFVDGRLAYQAFGPDQTARVRLAVTFECEMRFQAGEISPIEALAGGSIVGEWPDLMLASGLVEAPEYVDLLDLHARPLAEYLVGLSDWTWSSALGEPG
jgi:hypothetical protein